MRTLTVCADEPALQRYSFNRVQLRFSDFFHWSIINRFFIDFFSKNIHFSLTIIYTSPLAPQFFFQHSSLFNVNTHSLASPSGQDPIYINFFYCGPFYSPFLGIIFSAIYYPSLLFSTHIWSSVATNFLAALLLVPLSIMKISRQARIIILLILDTAFFLAEIVIGYRVGSLALVSTKRAASAVLSTEKLCLTDCRFVPYA